VLRKEIPGADGGFDLQGAGGQGNRHASKADSDGFASAFHDRRQTIQRDHPTDAERILQEVRGATGAQEDLEQPFASEL
jgi:hypothetical protein